ncbi:MAG: hypothetical protein NDI69_00405 [Bacteriovoracaceae bacterium]|nr:hypothetical protein [Bacteriovoracaceae bacterium]
MKHLNFAFVSIIFVGCAHFTETPKVVQFPYAADLLLKVQKEVSRMPASIGSENLAEISPRRIYFSALYHQYLTLGKHLDKKADINFCPQFHHDKIQTDSGLIPQVSLYRPKHVDSEGRNYFPELAFNKDFSLQDYHLVIKSELDTLCEDGVSDNFYKFDNLVTHYAHKRSFHQNPTAMTSVLKIPVFANFYLVKMLETPGLPGLEEKRFIKLTQTHWFENYVAEASQMRNHFIKNKMVRR